MTAAAFIVTLIVILCTSILFANFFKKWKLDKGFIDVVICGPTYSGKTALFLRLLRGSYAETQTSQSVNEGHIKRGDEVITLVDTPGHFRILSESVKFIERAKALVFVVDSSDKKSFKIAAQQLVDILLNTKVISNTPKLLFFSNKADTLSSRNPELVLHFVQLEAERILKAYKSESHMTNMSPEAMKVLNQLAQETFSMEKVYLPFRFCSGSVKSNELSQVRSFINDLK